MSENKNDGWPEFHPFKSLELLKKLGRFVLGPELFSPISDHFQNTGGGPMLDRELYPEETYGAWLDGER